MRTIRRSLAWLWPLLLAASPVGACDRAGFVIALDPGHTRANPGATSARGVPEVQFNAQLAEVVLRELWRAGFEQAFLTVEDQGPITLPERAARAGERHARLFLSLHHDAVQPQYMSDWVYEGRAQRYSDRFSGYSLFVSARNADEAGSLRMAQLLVPSSGAGRWRPRCITPNPLPERTGPSSIRRSASTASTTWWCSSAPRCRRC